MKFNNSKDDKFISASPIDLLQFKQISKLRSCAGHDYFGTNVFGEQEASSSMKHYAVPLKKFEGTKDVKIYAPFDGKIVKIGEGKPGTLGVGIWLETGNGWFFEFGHIELDPGFKAGDKVKSGQIIGWYGAQNGWALDLQFYHSGKYINMFSGIDSYINHLTPEVSAEYAKYGITIDTIIIPKETRDQNPCKTYDINPEEDNLEINKNIERENNE